MLIAVSIWGGGGGGGPLSGEGKVQGLPPSLWVLVRTLGGHAVALSAHYNHTSCYIATSSISLNGGEGYAGGRDEQREGEIC